MAMMTRDVQLILLLCAVGSGLMIFFSQRFDPPAPYKNCGDRPERSVPHRHRRMIGGQNITVDVWPWQVSVMYRPDSNAPFSQVCGGAIIHKYWIITAAACVNVLNRRALLIRAGSSTLNIDDEFTQKAEVARIILHEEYSPVTLRYSIALLQTKTPFVFNKFVDPICVPDEFAADHKYESCHITGYNARPDGGDIGVLQEANVYIMSRSLCNQPSFWDHSVSPEMLCVGDLEGGVDGCETNLGGPLNCYIEIEHHYYLIGIRVKASSCGQPKRPNVYLKVYTLYYWMEHVMNITFH